MFQIILCQIFLTWLLCEFLLFFGIYCTHLDVQRDFSQQVKANLSGVAGDYIANLCRSSPKLNPNSSLRFPLQLALLISPLCLLLPVNLDKRSFGRATLMQLSIRLGACKPELLRQTEKMLWKAILDIVNRPGEYLAIMEGLASAFPTSRIQELESHPESMPEW